MLVFLVLVLAFADGVMPLVASRRVMQLSATDTKRFLSSKRVLPAQFIGEDLPTSFDVRTAFPGCIHPILDQGQCGSCWAFASTEVLSDRFAIAGRPVELSPQDALECEPEHWGCAMGSMPEWAWGFLVKRGVAPLACMPYVSGNGSVPQGCHRTCVDGSAARYYRAANYTHAGDFIEAHKHTDAIMRALLSGPLDSTFIVYGDFDSYQPGSVYRHRTGGFAGLHSVKIVGWGEQNGELFWAVANSWGTSWGDNGFFKIARGVDECMFESQVYYGAPAL